MGSTDDENIFLTTGYYQTERDPTALVEAIKSGQVEAIEGI